MDKDFRNGEGTLSHFTGHSSYEVDKCECGKNKFSYQKVCRRLFIKGKKMPCKKITMKQKEFAEKAVELKNSTEAAMQVYACKNRNVAANIASVQHRNPKVKAEIERVLERNKVTEDVVAEKIHEAMNANVVTVLDGEAVQSEVADHQIRLKAAVEGAKMLDMYPPTRSESRTLNIDLELENMPPAQLAILLRELAQNIYAEPTNKKKLGTSTGSDENGEEIESQE